MQYIEYVPLREPCPKSLSLAPQVPFNLIKCVSGNASLRQILNLRLLRSLRHPPYGRSPSPPELLPRPSPLNLSSSGLPPPRCSRSLCMCRSNEDDLSKFLPLSPPPRSPLLPGGPSTTRPRISFGVLRRSCAKTTSSSRPLMTKRSISSRASAASWGVAYSIKAKPFGCCE